MTSNLIRIERNANNAYAAQFPQTCVYCGSPAALHVPLTASYSSGGRYNRLLQSAVFDVPYCNEHAAANKRYMRWLTVFLASCIVFSCIAQILISFALNLQEVFQVCVLGPALALTFAFTAGTLGVRRVWGLFNEEIRDLPAPGGRGGLGLRMEMGADGTVGFSFTRDEYAVEFARMNGRQVEVVE